MDTHPATPSAEDLQAHSQWVLGLARRLLRDGGAAEDVAQETWLAALQSPPQGELRPWLGQVCRNFAREHLRLRSRRTDRERLAASEERGLDPLELVERAEIGKVLVELVLALDEPYRSTMLLRYQEGLSTARIAEVQGVPAGTVRGRLSRAAEKLRTELDTRHGGERQTWCAGMAALVAPGRAPIAASAKSGVIAGALTMVGLHKLAATAATVLVVVWGVSLLGSDEPAAPAQTRGLEASEPAPPERSAGSRQTRPSNDGPAVAGALREPAQTPLASTRGRVIALGTQVAIEGVEVNLVRETDPTQAIATDRTGPDGLFSFEDPPDSARLAVAVPPQGWRSVPSRSSHPLHGNAIGETMVLVLRQARSARVRGRLVDEANGSPLGDFTLRLLLEQTWEDFTTDADGYFRSTREYEEGEYLLGLVDSGLRFDNDDSTWIDHLPWGDSEGRLLEVRARVGPTFALDIALPQGLLATDFQAGLRRGREPLEEAVAWARTRPVRDGEPPWVRYSNEDVEDVGTAGPWHIEVGSLDGLWVGWAPVPDVRGVQLDRLRVELTQCGRLAGRVVDERGQARASIGLELVRQAEGQSRGADTAAMQRHRAQSHAGGSYSIAYVRPGDYWLAVSQHASVEAAPIPVRVEAGVSLDPLDVQVRARQGAGSVAGRVRSATGAYHGSTRIRILARSLCQSEVEWEWEESEGEWVGRFEVTGVPEGEHGVLVETQPRYLLRTSSSEKVSAPASDLEIFVRDDVPTFDIQFRVSDAATGSRLARFLYEIDFAERFIGARSGDESDAPALRDVPEGRELEWSVRADGYAPAYGTESDVPGSDLPESAGVRVIDVRLEPGWGARFQFFDEDTGHGLTGVRVLFDGQEVGESGPDGNLDVVLAARPEKLAVSYEGWALSPDWSVDPQTGRFDDESWMPIYVALRRR